MEKDKEFIEMAAKAAVWGEIMRYASGYAKEPMEFKEIRGALYCFGSELACLRIFQKMIIDGSTMWKKRHSFGWSENLNTFYVFFEEKQKSRIEVYPVKDLSDGIVKCNIGEHDFWSIAHSSPENGVHFPMHHLDCNTQEEVANASEAIASILRAEGIMVEVDWYKGDKK